MHVAICSDDAYVTGVVVVIASVAFHDPGTRFTVLEMGISDANRARLAKLAETLKCRIDLITAPRELVCSVSLEEQRHLSQAALLRLLLPEILQSDDRVLYLDCDMLVLSSLRPIWETGLGKALAAAVPDRDALEAMSQSDAAFYQREWQRIGVERGQYVNSGLMLINLAAWRAEGTGRACLAFLGDRGRLRSFADQSAINAICKGRIILLDRAWNVFPVQFSKNGWENRIAAPFVLHFSGLEKPWKTRVIFGSLWWTYARSVRDCLPPDHTGLRGLLSRRRIKQAIRRAVGLMVGKRKHWAAFGLQRRAKRLCTEDRRALLAWQGH